MADTFDPKEHTVAEVNEYLEEAPPEVVEQVLQAEEATSKPRKGIVEGPAAGDTEVRTEPDGRVKYPWEVDSHVN